MHSCQKFEHLFVCLVGIIANVTKTVLYKQSGPMLSHSAIQFIITSNSLATLQHRVIKNIVLHLISAWDTFALPVETASCDLCDGGKLLYGSNGGILLHRGVVGVLDRGSGLDGSCDSNGGCCVESGFNVDIRLSGDFFVNVSFCLRPGLSILEKSSGGDGGGLDNGGEVICSSYGGNGGHRYGGDGVALGSSVPCSGKLGFGSLHLRGISNVKLGGSAGHSQSSDNNEALHFFFR